MTPAEAQVLLSMAAAFDNRKPDPDAAKAWAVALDGLTFEDCRVALIHHFKTSTDYLMPVTIRNAVLAVRKERRLAHSRDHGPLLPTKGLTDAEERRWMADALERISNGQVVESNGAWGELVTGPEVGFRELLPSPDATQHRDARVAAEQAQRAKESNA